MTAAERSAALLRQFDAKRQHHASARVRCAEPDCHAELICLPRHAENLTSTWRCLEHRTTNQKEATK